MGLRIKEVLDEKRISVAELAQKLNVTRGACYSYLNGNPTVDVLSRIADAIGVHITELFDSSDDEKPDSAKLEFYVSINGEMYKINQYDFVEFITKKHNGIN